MYYNQDAEVKLLCELLTQLGNKKVVDVGAEKGKLIEAMRDSGAEQVFAFEPYPPNVTVLQERFQNTPGVFIHDCALGAEDTMAALHIAEDKIGGDECYHSLITSADTP